MRKHKAWSQQEEVAPVRVSRQRSCSDSKPRCVHTREHLIKRNKNYHVSRADNAAEADAIENSPILEGEQATLFWSGTMRCAYLAQDRVDISETIKCLARVMSKPSTGHVMQLTRVARYLKGVPRKAQQYPAQ